MVVTQSMLDRARLCGACSDLPSVGTPLEELSPVHLKFAEEHELLTDAEKLAEIGRCDIPLSTLAGYGSGDGDGDGDGFGDGDGYGFGDGDGYGYGSGE